MSGPQELSCDVLVVGYGGAGACAAIEAAQQGASVLVLERFGGGGATRASGGVIYGGGTGVQQALGVADSPDEMRAYLEKEGQGLVDGEHLRAFCARSADDLAWLQALGLEFPFRFFGDKTVVPPAGVGLYYSGNEKHAPAGKAARGHVPQGHGQRGPVLFEGLERAAEALGVTVRRHCRVSGLRTDAAGRVCGADALDLPAAACALHGLAAKAMGFSRRGLGALLRMEETAGRPLRVEARRGVILATGGFVFNAEMMREHAPDLLGAMPLGTPGDDGAGIRMAQALGAATQHMDRCAAWRFLYPPQAFLGGVLVNGAGERFCDESAYGATVGRAIAAQPGGRAWLVVDLGVVEAVRREAVDDEGLGDRSLRELLSGQANDLLFRKWSTWANLHLNRKRAPRLEILERTCGMPTGALVESVHRHDRALREGRSDEFGKPDEYRRTLDRGPFLAIACELDNKMFFGPCFTLGGLKTEPNSARVLREDGQVIQGLFAAGRTAAGVATGGYVSGLSVADCVFSGRNAGRRSASG